MVRLEQLIAKCEFLLENLNKFFFLVILQISCRTIEHTNEEGHYMVIISLFQVGEILETL